MIVIFIILLIIKKETILNDTEIFLIMDNSYFIILYIYIYIYKAKQIAHGDTIKENRE